ncbi:beta-lactamase family protein [Nocardia cyriacigeorgica]|uniref:serine hydrolase domain-containing protein n=1 Tax=Nocardia cyriacigeorgica TaxID=135487 RepID=UPI001892E676|nr:serine hydrolase domain-containing protein [Nocardia cyriacigeorgica]MBF6100216.1 beta-lactamase family protein [Nocardia cyriacigeorgica]MBF6318396.1 beta-lactamase family protein [Nocardia cyriacigeorgica]MBF6398771.1 beta-lactamase family protein [Nocardia cyriacigeorgica]MBF6403715.1 beta-lactamase family protein [Nocardia cyriacigeorgica]MBF6533936.1 beta-lactamase family protein [Nocardia cyriacigeorgica]
MGTSRFQRHSRIVIAAAAVLLATAGCDGDAVLPTTTTPLPVQVSDALTDLARSGLPGAQAVLSGPDGQHTVTGGAGNLSSGAPYADGAHIRIGSVTKTFVATVVLQLAAEGAVDLDAPIERYLPDVVRGNGNDGNRVTVRQLLQHTSGLPDFAPEDPSHNLPQQLDQTSDGKAYRELTPADLVGIAMSIPPQFDPGARFHYTNTNYVLSGMLIERRTGRPLATEIGARILEPLAMHDTYIPLAGDTGLRDPHPLGYRNVDRTWVDATDTEVAWLGAAGAMVSTGADVNRFFLALLTGKLLPAPQLAQMKQTNPTTSDTEMNYGLGLMRSQVPCGAEGKVKEFWGHSGSVRGFTTLAIATPDRTAATISVNTAQTNDQFSTAMTTIACAIA